MIRRFRLLGNALTAGSSPVVRRASSSNSVLFSHLFRLNSAADHTPTSYASLISGFSSCFTGDLLTIFKNNKTILLNIYNIVKFLFNYFKKLKYI